MTDVTTTPSLPCVGRERELGRLGELHRESQQHGQRFAWLTGASGVGKSRLLQAFRHRVRLDGGVVLDGRCTPGAPFGVLADIVQKALRFLEEMDRTGRLDLADLSCQAGCHRFWYQHDGLDADVPPSTPGLWPSGGQERAAIERRYRFFEALRSVLAAVAEVRAPVILIQDVDRADRGTLEFLKFLADTAGPWNERVAPGRNLRSLVVCSLRSELHEGRQALLEETVAEVGGETLDVGDLDADGVKALLQSEDIVARVLQRTSGNPDAIERLLEADLLTPRERVARKLEELTPSARAVVECLAVMQRPCTEAQLADVAARLQDAGISSAHDRRPLASNRLREPVRQELEACALLTRLPSDDATRLVFAREGDRESVVAQLPPSRTQALHQAAADAYAADAGAIEDAAFHAMKAENFPQAVPLALRAAKSLSARHAHAEAASLLEALVQRLGEDTPTEVRNALADLYRAAGSYDQALVHARRVAQAAPNNAAAARRVGELLTLSGLLEEATRVLQQARALLRDDHTREGRTGLRDVAETDALLAELFYQRGDYVAAENAASTALDLAMAEADTPLAIHARNTLGKLSLAARDTEKAQSYFRKNREAAAAEGLVHQLSQAHTNLGVSYLQTQAMDDAEAAFRAAVDVSSRVGDTRERAIATENLAVMHHLRRDYIRAQARYHESIALLKRLGNKPMLARVGINMGELYLSLGEVNRARRICDFATQMAGAQIPPAVEAEVHVLRGRVDAMEGALRKARASFEAAADRYRSLGDARLAEALLEIGKIAVQEGDLDTARAQIRNLPEQKTAKGAAEITLLAGTIERASGRSDLDHCRRAAALAIKANDDELLLPAQARWARALVDSGDLLGAERLLHEAQATESRLAARVPEESLLAWTTRPMRRELEDLQAVLSRAWQQAPERRPRRQTTPPQARPGRNPWSARFPNIAGRSPAMSQVLALVDKVAPTDAQVLIRGESGTGKELIAQALHENSPRAKKPFVKVNCGALVETLLLSELFGHERGAFTGASARKKGRFELADGGTLFLDEIGDISAKTQVALLRVLQEKEFERVGGTQSMKVDVRIVAATHRDLEAMVREGTFREDLYYRLRGVMVHMPSLRDHLEDLPEVCDQLLHRIASERGEPKRELAPQTLELLSRHRWPGNVRELENILRSATLFADGATLFPEDFAAFAGAFDLRPAPTLDDTERSPLTAVSPVAGPPVEDAIYAKVREGDCSLAELKKAVERECIVRALRETDGNITHAAQLLGMKRPRLSQLVKQYSLQASDGDAS